MTITVAENWQEPGTEYMYPKTPIPTSSPNHQYITQPIVRSFRGVGGGCVRLLGPNPSAQGMKGIVAGARI